MNDRDLWELQQLRKREESLRQELEGFAGRIRALEARLQSASAAPEPKAAETPPPLPPIAYSPMAQVKAEPEPLKGKAERESMEVVMEPGGTGPCQEAGGTGSYTAGNEPPAPPVLPIRIPLAKEESLRVETPMPRKPESFEMRLGTYWFVRVGVVLLLTALAFLGNYAYQNFIFNMGPAGKITLLYFASFLLLGTGGWLRRKDALPSLKNYAEVLFAGGLAAVYFTTYAAHHVDRLRVIQSAVLDGTLLLGWAAFIVWLADRRKSEVMAMFALGLAYYTATITRTGSFTLYSNLVLTVASVFFLARNRWVVLSALALPATYGSYAFWRFHAYTGWRFPSPEEGLVFSAAFLAAYWLVFTAAVFLSKDERSKGPPRAAFLSMNNGAALSLFLLTMLQMHTGGLWKVCMGFGSVLLILAWVSRKVLPDDRLAEDSYLVQGLALVTTGIIARFSGNDLPLLLAAESVILFILGCRLGNIFIRGGGWVSALLAVGWAMDILQPGRQSALYVGLAVSAALMINTIFAHRHTRSADLLRPEVAYFALLLVALVGSVCWTHSERANLPVVVMAVTLGLTLSMHLLRIREIVLFSQALGFFALFAWSANAAARSGPWEPWTQPVLTMACALALLHWWQHQRAMPTPRNANTAFQALYAFIFMVILCTWVLPHVHSGAKHHVVPVMTGLVVAATLYSAFTRSGVLAITAQFFLLPVILLFLDHLSRSYSWQSALVLPIAIFLLASGAAAWRRSHTELSPAVSARLGVAARSYYWVGLALLALCIARYVPARNCPWVYALIALLPFAVAGARNPQALAYALALLICAAVAFVAPANDKVWANLANLIYVAVLLGVQRVARRLHERYQMPESIHTALMLLGGLSLWLLLSRYVQQNVTGFLLTVAWSVVALVLFGLGMALRERPYRWLGLVVLGASLTRVVLMDVWKLDVIYRIFSFMALGLVLVLLGYIYNRFQEKIRSWL